MQNYLDLYVMTTKEFAKKYSNREYDYIHIDGDHSYKGVKLDFDLFWSKLTKGDFCPYMISLVQIKMVTFMELGIFGKN